ncbi:hypothetical protein [Metallosphaera hakonensis]|uniref:CDC48 domain-containing protein n=1 Tax=Metallosphaera hakonensis JCM 8857 = DSM 7519 TaxID=1293036 RepID=A0A2U9IR97_9CREN|nr:hypothetical protein [Metallosphaera hakonensis]AWR98535.1 hypothetical protein DFR87_01125 [Metallosphaera hakonensis JCM 8857 = DSM 7519]
MSIKLILVEGKREGNKVRMNKSTMKRAGIREGDYVVVGNSLPLKVASGGVKEGEIKVDEDFIKALSLSPGSEVEVRKIQVLPGKRIELTPRVPLKFDEDFLQYVREVLFNHVVSTGESIKVNVALPGSGPLKRKEIPVELTVTHCEPGDHVVVNEDTVVVIREIQDPCLLVKALLDGLGFSTTLSGTVIRAEKGIDNLKFRVSVWCVSESDSDLKEAIRDVESSEVKPHLKVILVKGGKIEEGDREGFLVITDPKLLGNILRK